MNISLIGMSGSGKSYWSKKLAAYGYRVYCVDDLIEEKLGAELQRLGYRGIGDVAKWMGQPFDTQYKETSSTYLHFENEVMREVLSGLQTNNTVSEHVVIDTTGSLVYTDKTLQQKLKELTHVVYLETPQSVQQQMYEVFIKHPKPVIWGESFVKQRGESDMDALKRCYPELLAFRTKAYETLANKAVAYYTRHGRDFTLATFIEELTR